MNANNKLNKKFMKTIITIMLAVVFLIGEVFSPFAIRANADSYQTIKVIVKDADTGQRINEAGVTFNGPGGSGDSYSGTSETDGTCYINVHNGSEKQVGVTVNKSGYGIWNVYDNNYYYIKYGSYNKNLVVKGSWKDNHEIIIELKKNSTTNNTTPSTIGSKPQFTVTMDSYTPSNPSVGGEITFTGTIHPQDFEIPITAKEIVLVLDSSGSMSGTKMEKLEDAAKQFIDKMSTVENLKIGIVDFDTQATVVKQLTSSKNVDTLKESITNLVAGGGTNTGEGLREAAYLLNTTSTANKIIVFMSDGEPTFYNAKNITGSWVWGNYTGKYYKHGNKYYGIDSQNYYDYNNYYEGSYTGYKYIYNDSGYYMDTTKSGIDSNVGLAGSGLDDYQGKCLEYATTIGAIIKNKGYNVFSIGYELDASGTTKMQQIHDSISSVSGNFFESDTDSIDSIFNSIANTILDTYPITDIKFNFNPNANPSIESVDGNTISLPDFNYKKVDSTSSTIKYTADPVSFTVKVKSNIVGNDIPVFTTSTSTSTVTFPWKSETISANVPKQTINIGNIDTTPPELTLTASTTENTSGSVEITARATDNVAVASITTPDNNTVSFNPAATNSTTYTATTNGDYIFKATDTAGNVTTKTINIKNIVSENVASKPQFTVTMDPSYLPANPDVDDEITFNGMIYPEDFQISIPEKEIVLALDSSGSMGNNLKLYNLKIAAKNFINKMKDVKNLKIGIVDFDTQALCGSQLIDSSNVTALNSAIDNLYASGGTNTGEGLRLGAYLLSNSSNSTANKTIVFMSDGEPTYYNWKDNQYYADITQQSIDSSVQRKGTGSSDTNGYCLDYAKTIGAIIKEKGYNAFSIGYGLDSSGTTKMQQIHDSMSSISDNFFESDTGSIDSVFDSIANAILDTYTISDVKFNFNGGTNSNIVSVDGDPISLPDFNYTISSQTSSTVKYTAEPVPFTVKIKSKIEGTRIPVFTSSTVTFPWKSEIIKDEVDEQYINVGSIVNVDNAGPELTLTPSTTAVTNQDVVITASATDDVAVASITTPDNNIVEFNPAVPNNSTTYTVSTNGTYKFVAIDTAGNKTEESIIVSNIDKTPPIITIGQYNTNPTNQDITVTATTNEGVLNATFHVFSENGSYTFTATDSAGNTASETVTITNIDKIAPTLILTLSKTNGIVIITATASDSGSGVASITKPDTTVITGNSTTYTVNAIGTYTFTAIDNAGNTTTQSITYEKSNILYHGLYNGNGANITEKSEAFGVSDEIPVTLAMIVDAKSSNPEIQWSADNTKIPQGTIQFKMYKISDLSNGTIDKDSLQTLNLNNSGNINITGFTMERGNQYLIVYTITPVGSGATTVTATADGTSTKSVYLNISALPDLF